MEKRQTCLDLSNFTIKRKLTILSETNHSFSNSNTHHLDEVLIYLGLVGSVLDGYLTCSMIVQKQKIIAFSETIDFASESSYHHFDEILMFIGLIGDR